MLTIHNMLWVRYKLYAFKEFLKSSKNTWLIMMATLLIYGFNFTWRPLKGRIEI